MNIAIEFRIDQLQANGTYNVRRVEILLHGKRVSIKVTGWLGFEWIPLESQGQQPFTAALINGTLSPQVLLFLLLESPCQSVDYVFIPSDAHTHTNL